jgi:hypothetical protein
MASRTESPLLAEMYEIRVHEMPKLVHPHVAVESHYAAYLSLLERLRLPFNV